MMNKPPKKHFSQNFLQDEGCVLQIIKQAAFTKTDKVLEIGPGQGALTKHLLSILDKLYAIEIDRDLETKLRNLAGAEKLALFFGDALTADYQQWGKQLRVIGNLPYHISSPLLFHLLSFRTSIQDMYFMLQKEVVERIVAKPGSKAYGRLSVMLQYYCEAEYLFSVPPESFYPKPKVDSAMLYLRPHPQQAAALPLTALEKIVAQAFSMRRKTLANNLKPFFTATELSAINLDPKQRAEELSIADYVLLTEQFLRKFETRNKAEA